MALSTGQINDAFQAALGRFPTGDEMARISADARFDGDPGKNLLIRSLEANFLPPAEFNARQADRVLQQSKNAVLEATNPLLEADRRAGQFEAENPFSFDEVLARASAEERLDPSFQAELDEFTEGIQIRRRQSEESEKSILSELNVQTQNLLGDVKRRVTDAIDSTRKGFAGAGLFLSGGRLREEGRERIAGEEERERGLASLDVRRKTALGGAQTTQDLLGLQERSGRRTQKAARETTLITDVERQKQEAQRRRGEEARQFVFGGLDTPGANLTSLFGFS